MNIIVPAIIPTSREDLEDKLLRLQGISEGVQIDVVDGIFASPPSWPCIKKHPEGMMTEMEALDFLGGLHLEVDLMVTNPEEHIEPWVGAGANRITLHAGSTQMLSRLLQDMQVRYGHDKDFASGLLSVGLALHAEMEIAMLDPFISHIDYVQVMGIGSVGRQAQPFDKRVLPKLRALKKKYPTLPVQVDGGVSLETAPALLSAGASRLIVGSALWKAKNLKDAYQKFIDLTTSYGVYSV
jgi:ribulose-phosphate 3-epimerase